MESLENVNTNELAEKALNFSQDEWEAVLAAAPLALIVNETHYRLTALEHGLAILTGGSKTWN